MLIGSGSLHILLTARVLSRYLGRLLQFKEQVVGHSTLTLGVKVSDSGSDATAAW